MTPETPQVRADWRKAAQSSDTLRRCLGEIHNDMIHGDLSLEAVGKKHNLNRNLIRRIARSKDMVEFRQMIAGLQQTQMLIMLQNLINLINDGKVLRSLSPRDKIAAIPKLVSAINGLGDQTGAVQFKLSVTATATEASQMNAQVRKIMESAGLTVPTTGFPQIDDELEELIEQIPEKEVLAKQDDKEDEKDEFAL